MATDLQIGQWYYYHWGHADVYQGQLMAYDEQTAVMRDVQGELRPAQRHRVIGPSEPQQKPIGFWKRLFSEKDGE